MFLEDKATWHNDDLKERLTKCLPELRKLVDAEYIYETNLDSDDMVHKNFTEIVLEHKFKERGALYCKDGFAYNTEGRLAQWNNPISNQNYTIMFPREVYFNPEKRLEYLDGFNTHEQVPEKFEAEEMPKGMYCTTIHGKNISTVWEHPFRGEEFYYEDEKINVLKEFGV